MPNNLFALRPRSARPTATNDTMISGIINDRKDENNELKVANARMTP